MKKYRTYNRINWFWPVNKIIILTFLILFLPGILEAQDQQLKDRNKITQLIDDYAHAREQNDPEKIQMLFTSDADQLVSSGEWRYGMESLVEGMLRSSASNPGDRSLTVETIRFFNKHTAIADARYEIKAPDGTVARKMWSTFVVVIKKGQWKIAAIRNMLPAG